LKQLNLLLSISNYRIFQL